MRAFKKLSPPSDDVEGDSFASQLLASMDVRDVFSTAFAAGMVGKDTTTALDAAKYIESHTTAAQQEQLLSFECSGDFMAQVCDLRLQTPRPTTVMVGTLVAVVSVSFFVAVALLVLVRGSTRTADAIVRVFEQDGHTDASGVSSSVLASNPTVARSRASTHAALWVTGGVGAAVTGVVTGLTAAFAEKMRINANSNARCGVLRESLSRSKHFSTANALCMQALWPGDLDRGFDTVRNGIVRTDAALHAQHLNVQAEWWYFAANTKTVDTGASVDVLLLFMRHTLVPRGFLLESDPRTLAGTSVYSVTGGVTFMGEQYAIEPIVLNGANPLFSTTDVPVSWMFGNAGFRSTAPASSKSIFPFDIDLTDTRNRFSLHMTLDNSRYPQDENLLLQGDRGFVPPCAPRVGIGMQYYSFPNVSTTCDLRLNGTKHTSSGVTWVDHQFGNNIKSDSRIPSAWPRWLDAIATAQEPSQPMDMASLGGWRWFALHMQERDGTWSHWTGEVRLMNSTARRESALFACDSGKGFFESTGSFVNFNDLSIRVYSTKANGRVPMDAGVPFPTQVTVSFTAGASSRTVELYAQARSADYLHATPNTFYEMPVSGTWSPIGSDLELPVYGFLEQQGTGAFQSQIGGVFKGAGVSLSQAQALWFRDKIPSEPSASITHSSGAAGGSSSSSSLSTRPRPAQPSSGPPSAPSRPSNSASSQSNQSGPPPSSV